MSEEASISLWKNRIEIRKASGLKVGEWCQQNDISKNVYYYWNSKVKKQMQRQNNVFVEVSVPEKTPNANPSTSVKSESGMMIQWKNVSIMVKDASSVELAVMLLGRLEKEC